MDNTLPIPSRTCVHSRSSQGMAAITRTRPHMWPFPRFCRGEQGHVGNETRRTTAWDHLGLRCSRR
jgi:hypothetical protein